MSLLAVEPSNVALLKPEFSSKPIVIPDVGNPGGVFSFSSDMNSTYTVQVMAAPNVLVTKKLVFCSSLMFCF